MNRFLLHTIAIIFFQFTWVQHGYSQTVQIEMQVLDYLASKAEESHFLNQLCDGKESYSVYLIDNFDEQITIVPEVGISHGELVHKFLLSGRDDIQVTLKNTSLNKGLASVLLDLKNGECTDAVLSSIPGSNYSYQQVSSLLPGNVLLSPANILDYRDALLKLFQQIAYSGFPSVEWLEKIDANPIKLLDDARKIAFIEALGKFHVPVFLPYGNADRNYKGEQKKINILSLTQNAKVYSAIDHEGKRIKNFPYSPLASGKSQAIFTVVECPDYEDARLAFLDINEDGHGDFSYKRADLIPYYDENSNLSYAPALASDEALKELKSNLTVSNSSFTASNLVLTREDFYELKELCTNCKVVYSQDTDKSIVWLNSEKYGPIFSFNPQCQQRTTLTGTSLIPPLKVKEFLVPRLTSILE